MLAPLQVTALVRVLDAGATTIRWGAFRPPRRGARRVPLIDRVWRLSRAISEDGLLLRTDVPYEPGRPVRVELVLPDDELMFAAVGRVEGVAPDQADAEREGEHARARAISFTTIDDADRARLVAYVQERMLIP